MKIAIDIRDAGKEKTGKGWYTYNIVGQLLKLDSQNQYILYSNNKKNPFAEFKNVELKCIEDTSAKWHFKVLKDLRGNPVDLFLHPQVTLFRHSHPNHSG